MLKQTVTWLAMTMALTTYSTLVNAAGPNDIPANELEIALKATPDAKKGRDVYEVCSACHLPEGWGQTDGTFPQIAGQHRSVMIKQLADIRSKKRDNPTMYPFSLPSEIGDAQSLADVSEYVSKLPMNPENGVGPGTDLENGKKLYETNCVRCHGAGGEGDEAKLYPRIQGQHFQYLLHQFELIRDGKRQNADPEMVKQIKAFDEKQMQAVVDYTSRLKPPKEKLGQPGWKNPDFK